MRHMSLQSLFSMLSIVLMCSVPALAQRPTSLRGQVTDQLGAVVVGVSVTIIDANSKKTTTQTDSNGAYRFDNLTTGLYTLSVQQKGFSPETINAFQMAAGANTHDFQLSVAIEEQRVTVR